MSSLVLPVLNTVIALVFVYTLLSIITSNAVEYYFTTRHVKAKKLLTIFKTIWGNEVLEALKKHALVDPSSGDDIKVGRVPAAVLAKALIDIKAQEHKISTTDQQVLFDSLKSLANTSQSNKLDEVLRSILRSADSMVALERELTTYIDSIYLAEREKFKPVSQRYLFSFGLVLAVLLNINTIRLVGYFWDNPLEAEAVAEQATAFVAKADAAAGQDTVGRKIYHALKAKAIIDELNAVKAPWGWVFIDDSAYVRIGDKEQTNDESASLIASDSASSMLDTVQAKQAIQGHTNTAKPIRNPVLISQSQDSLNAAMDIKAEVYFQTLRKYLVSHEKGKIIRINAIFSTVLDNLFNWRNLIGWLVTAAAISFGAPFWYDLLKQFTSLRKEIKGN